MMNEKKILVADSSDIVSSMISAYLNRESYSILTVHDGIAALEQYASWNPDLIIADLNLPGINGTLLCRTIRQASSTPIILISEQTNKAALTQMLRLGADDFLFKPLDLEEMSARVFAILRRCSFKTHISAVDKDMQYHTMTSAKSVLYQDLSVDMRNYTVICKGKTIDMPLKEIELLYFLASSPNQVFTRDQLLNHIWGYDYTGDTRTVDVHVKRIRQKLGTHETWSINTVWGVGYRFKTQ